MRRTRNKATTVSAAPDQSQRSVENADDDDKSNKKQKPSSDKTQRSHQGMASHEPNPQIIEEPNESLADVQLVDSQQHQRDAAHDPVPQAIGETLAVEVCEQSIQHEQIDEIQEPREGERRREQDHNAEPINEPLPQVDNAEPINEPLRQFDNAEPINEPLPQVNQRVSLSQGKTLRASQGKIQRRIKRSQRDLGDEESQNESRRRVSRRVQDPDEDYDEAFFDQQFHAEALRHRSAARMMYDPVLDTYWVSLVRGRNFTKAEEVRDVGMYDEILVNQARRNPNIWQGCSVGDPLDGNVPSDLATTVPTPYRQHNNKYCLTLSLANALRTANSLHRPIYLIHKPVFSPSIRLKYN